MKNNCYITETDTFRTILYDANKCIDLFGEDFLTDYGHFVPDGLISEFNRIENERKSLEKKLDLILKEKYENKT